MVKENEELKKQVTEHRAKNDAIIIREIDRQQKEKKRQKDEIEALKRIKQLLMVPFPVMAMK